MSSEIVKHEASGTGALMRQATDVAGVCRDIVTKTAQAIDGRKYVRVEGWQSIAVAYGCVASSRDVERVPGGVRAVGEVRRMSDGAVVSTAEGFVGEDEVTWYGGKNRYGKELPKRPEYAIRAMAQTRAISRACRSAFAFVVTLIDGNLSTTPAEEVPEGGFIDAVASPVAQRQDDLKATLAASVRVAEAAKAAKASPPRVVVTETGARQPLRGGGPTTLPNYGKAKGQPIAGADMRTLEFYANGCRKSLADPAKANWHAKEAALLEAIQDEMARQSGPGDDGPPPPTDADAPPEDF